MIGIPSIFQSFAICLPLISDDTYLFRYVLENSGRFDPRSGNLLSMRSRDIARRSGAAYAEDQKTDTYVPLLLLL